MIKFGPDVIFKVSELIFNIQKLGDDIIFKLAASCRKPGHTGPACLLDKRGLQQKLASFPDRPPVRFSSVPTGRDAVLGQANTSLCPPRPLSVHRGGNGPRRQDIAEAGTGRLRQQQVFCPWSPPASP